MSPHTVTGHFCAIVSGGWRRSEGVYVPRAVRSTRPGVPRGPIAHLVRMCRDHAYEQLSHTFSQSRCTSLSANCLQLMRLSIQPSRVGIVVGSVVGADDSCMGSGIFTSSILVSMVAGAVDSMQVGWSVVVM
jgi:hypothetical protein